MTVNIHSIWAVTGLILEHKMERGELKMKS